MCLNFFVQIREFEPQILKFLQKFLAVNCSNTLKKCNFTKFLHFLFACECVVYAFISNLLHNIVKELLIDDLTKQLSSNEEFSLWVLLKELKLVK